MLDTRFQRSLRYLLCLVFAVFAAGGAWSQELEEKSLPLNGQIAVDGSSVTLNWFDADQPRKYPARVSRRLLGATGGASWEIVAPAVPTGSAFVDTNVRPGQAYEYRVERLGRNVVDVGYWTTGVDLPERGDPGTIYLVVDETLAGELTAHILRFERDLIGDGWRVVTQRVPRGTPSDVQQNLSNAGSLRAWLKRNFELDPMGQHSVVLIGHAPVLRSGNAYPDGHEPQPQATDLFYADIDGVWSLDRSTLALGNNRVPSNAIEMQIGRIDFANVGDRDAELAHLRSYFNKNHHWRHGLLGDLRVGYAGSGLLRVEEDGLRNIVGPDDLTKGGHHDVGELGPWLWGVDFGDFDGANYEATHSNEAIFTINFGSGKQQFNSRLNPMTMLLAQPFYPLTVGWGGRPSWRIHHMAIGRTIGESHFRTVNNGESGQPYRESMDYWPTGQYLWQNPVWVNLLGDPSLRAFVLAPPEAVSVAKVAEGSFVEWTASRDPDVTGYRVFRFEVGGQPLLLGEVPESDRGFVDQTEDAQGNALYMVQAVGKKSVFAGSFKTTSQAVFGRALFPELEAETVLLRAQPGVELILPQHFQVPENGTIYAVIEPPKVGDLRVLDGNWRYLPPVDFSGEISMRYSKSDALRTTVGELRIVIE